MRRRLNAFTIVGMIVVFTGLGHLLPALLAGGENRWTPRDLAVGLEESADRVCVLVSGTPLEKHLEAGTLQVGGQGESPRTLQADEVQFRFNNWDRVRADLYFWGMLTASYTTAGVAALLVGLLRVPRLPGRSSPAASTD